MATNKPTGDNARKGAVRKRSQTKTTMGGATTWTKRDRSTGEFMAIKKASKTAKKASAKKTSARKATTTKTSARKTSARKTSAPKTRASKTSARKTSTRAAAARKTVAKKFKGVRREKK